MPDWLVYGAVIAGVLALGLAYQTLWVRALERLAAARGWREATAAEVEEAAQARGGGGVTHLVTGAHDGRRFLAGPRSWTTGLSGKRTKHDEQLVVLELPVGMPAFSAEYSGRFAEAVADAFQKDVDVPDDPAFSASWRVLAEKPAAALALLTREVREVLGRQRCGIRVSGTRLAWWRSGQTGWPSEYDVMLRLASDAARALENAAAVVEMTPGAKEALAAAPVVVPPAPTVGRGVLAVGRLGLGGAGFGLFAMAGFVAGVGGYAMVDAIARGTGDRAWWTYTGSVTGIAALAAMAGLALMLRARRA